MASGALPPAFPAVRIGEGQLVGRRRLFHTPVEAVRDDRPRRDWLIISVNMWPPVGCEPASIREVLNRQKDIQYPSRGTTHVVRQDQIHPLAAPRPVRQLAMKRGQQQNDPEVREPLSDGCGAIMHLVRLMAPRFDPATITPRTSTPPALGFARWQAGVAYARRVLAEKPWEREVDPLQGIIIDESLEWRGTGQRDI
jgi:NTE family protein